MIRKIASLALVAGVLPAHAADFNSLGALTPQEWTQLTRDLGAAFAYKGVTPATPLGALGLDIGLEVTDTKMESSAALARAGAGSHTHLVIPKLHIHKGLIGGLDIGAFLGGTSQIGATLYGADLSYAFLDDTLTTPAVALRVSGTKAAGLGKLSIGTAAADLLVSKKFLALTPYAGGGVARVQATAHGTALEDQSFNKGRGFAGLNVNLVGVNLAFEVEKMGGNTSLSAKIGMRF
jgi:hypothetical protein